MSFACNFQSSRLYFCIKMLLGKFYFYSFYYPPSWIISKLFQNDTFLLLSHIRFYQSQKPHDVKKDICSIGFFQCLEKLK